MSGPIRVSAETLELASAELARIGEALTAGEREGCGVLVLRNADGTIVAAGISEDARPGQIVDLVLPGRHRAALPLDVPRVAS